LKAWIRGGTLLIPCRKLMQSGLLLENGKILGLLAPGEALPGEIAAMSRQVRSMHPPAGIPLRGGAHGATNKGILAEGYDADVILFDEQVNITRTLVMGRTAQKISGKKRVCCKIQNFAADLSEKPFLGQVYSPNFALPREPAIFSGSCRLQERPLRFLLRAGMHFFTVCSILQRALPLYSSTGRCSARRILRMALFFASTTSRSPESTCVLPRGTSSCSSRVIETMIESTGSCSSPRVIPLSR
jgi:hypothetical protein